MAAMRSSVSRRILLPLIAATFLLIPMPLLAQAFNIAPLKALIDVIGAAAESIEKLSVAIEGVVVRGDRALSELTARNSRARLIRIHKSIVGHISGRRVIMEDIRGYLETYGPPQEVLRMRYPGPNSEDWEWWENLANRIYIDTTGEEWDKVISHLRGILVSVETLLSDFKEEDSNFVLEDAYVQVVETLYARSNTLNELIEMPPPRTRTEFELLYQLRDRYIELIENLERADQALALYLKEQE